MLESRCCLIEEYTIALKEYLQNRRDFRKTIFKIVGTVYRGVNNNRFTLDEGLMAIKKLPRRKGE